ncbi:bcl-2-binding component 3-like [Sus scrofa]|uniref:bcl-2-binding component 3-like n=1 Tax=Sus scrofa TaxID=9823 RepID=UPI000A2B845D|nr:bcl-2-binding component 3-like [Sus scrofa]
MAAGPGRLRAAGGERPRARRPGPRLPSPAPRPGSGRRAAQRLARMQVCAGRAAPGGRGPQRPGVMPSRAPVPVGLRREGAGPQDCPSDRVRTLRPRPRKAGKKCEAAAGGEGEQRQRDGGQHGSLAEPGAGAAARVAGAGARSREPCSASPPSSAEGRRFPPRFPESNTLWRFVLTRSRRGPEALLRFGSTSPPSRSEGPHHRPSVRRGPRARRRAQAPLAAAMPAAEPPPLEDSGTTPKPNF